MRIVIALGGNALLRRGHKPDAAVQQHNVVRAVQALAPLAEEHQLVLTHGNGPQVGVLALQSASDPNLTTPYPFDVLGAQTQGMIRYWLLQALQNALPGRQVAAIINQTLVSVADPAFADPTKFVGQVYDERTAKRLAADRGWTVKQDGPSWRRVVPSPAPQRVVEPRLIRLLLNSGAIVVCGRGGGVWSSPTRPRSCATSAPPSRRRSDTRPPRRCVVSGSRPGRWEAKVEAVCRFVEVTGDMAAIGALEDAPAILQGSAGTIVTPGGDYGGTDDLRPRH